MNERELQLLRKLEYIKYITLTTGRIIHSSTAERTHFDNGSGVLTLNTPEGLTLKIKNFRINYKRPDGEGKCSITIDWARDDEGNLGANYAMIPSLPIKEMTNGNKLFVFHSEQFRALPEENRNYYNSEIDNYIDSGGFWLHIYSALIEISQENGHFQAFMNMEYGSDTAIGTWRYFFKQALDQALANSNPSIDNLLKYDPRILQREIKESEIYNLLEKFDVLNLPPDVILNLLDTTIAKDNKKSKSINLIYLLKNNSTGLLKRLNYFFFDESDEYFFKFHKILNSVFQETLDFTDFISIENKAIDTFDTFENNHELFIKLAEESNVFFYNTKLGLLNADAHFVTEFQYFDGGFSENTINNIGKISFSYKCYSDFQIFQNPFLDVINLNPFSPVKLFFIEGFEQLEYINTKDKYLKFTIFSESREGLQFSFVSSFFLISLIKAQQDSIYKHASDILILQGALAARYQFPILSVSGGLSVATVVSFSGSVLFNNSKINNYLNQNFPNFISNWDIVQQGLITFDLIHAGLYGVRNIQNLIQNYSQFRNAVNALKLDYKFMSAEMRGKLKLLMRGGAQFMDEILVEWETYLASVDNAFQTGYTIETVLNQRQLFKDGLVSQMWSPSVYLRPGYINGHQAKFDNGYTFFAVKPKDVDWLIPDPSNGIYAQIGPAEGKFVLPFSQANELLLKTENIITRIESELGIPSDASWSWSKKIKENGYELIRVDILPNQISWRKMPEGIEQGANELWLPGGKTPKNWDELIIESISKTNILPSQITIINLK